MRSFIVIITFLFVCKLSFAQLPKVTSVACGEYSTSFVADDGHIYGTYWNGAASVITDINLAAGIKEKVTAADGGQYHTGFIAGGKAYTVVKGKEGTPVVTAYLKDEKGNVQQSFTKIYAWFDDCWFVVKNNDSLFYFGNDRPNLRQGKRMPTLIKISIPAGKKIVKLAFGEQNTAPLILFTDGTVYKFDVVKKTFLQLPGIKGATDITQINLGKIYIIATKNDLLAMGEDLSFIGFNSFSKKPTSVKVFWPANMKFPLKEIKGIAGTLHIIDAENNLFAAGETACGIIGNGANINWENYKAPYAWDWGKTNQLQSPQQIFGKWKNICGTNNFCFYMYIQEYTTGDWYACGRNKSNAIVNSIKMKNDDQFPNHGDQPWLFKVGDNDGNPLSVKWPAGDGDRFDAGALNANVKTQYDFNKQKQEVQLSAELINKEDIAAYQWTQINGPVITQLSNTFSRKNANTVAAGLTKPGLYTYVLRITTKKGIVSYYKVIVVV